MTKTILIVEDSPMEMQLMMSILQDRGFLLLSATDGEQALHMAKNQRPDLILLDVVLPKKNGYQVCRQLKSSPETSHSRIVMVSSKSQPTDRFWGLKQGADDYLTKPIDAAEVLAAIQKVL